MGRKNKRRGFTLIELLATIAIISIISIITFFAINNIIDKSSAAVTKVNKKTIVNAALLYVQEFKIDDYWEKTSQSSSEEFICISINQLKNKGYLKGNLVDEKSGESYDETFVKVVRDSNKVISSNPEIATENDCLIEPTIEIEVSGDTKKYNEKDWFYNQENTKVILTLNNSIDYFKSFEIAIDGQDVANELKAIEISKKNYKYELELGKISDLGKDTTIYTKASLGSFIVEKETKINVDFTTPTTPTLTDDGLGTGNFHSSDFELKISGGGTSPSGIYYKYKINGSAEQKVGSSKIITVNKNTKNTIEVKACNNLDKCSGYTKYTTIKEPLIVTGQITGKLLFTEDYDKIYFSNIKINETYKNYTKISYYVKKEAKESLNTPKYNDFKSSNEFNMDFDISNVVELSATPSSTYYKGWVKAEDDEGNIIIEYIGYARFTKGKKDCDKDNDNCRIRITKTKDGDTYFVKWYDEYYKNKIIRDDGDWNSRVFDAYDGDELYITYPYYENTNTGRSFYIDFFKAGTHPYYMELGTTIKDKTWYLIESDNNCDSGYSCPNGGYLSSDKQTCTMDVYKQNDQGKISYCDPNAKYCTDTIESLSKTQYIAKTNYNPIRCSCESGWIGQQSHIIEEDITPAGGCLPGFTKTNVWSESGCGTCNMIGFTYNNTLKGGATCTWNGDYDSEIVDDCKPKYEEAYGCPETPKNKEKVHEANNKCYYCIKDIPFTYFDYETLACMVPEYLKKYAYVFSYFYPVN